MLTRRRPTAALAVVCLLTTPFLVTAAPWVVGANATYVVASDSMVPAIREGSVVVVVETPPSRLERGDVITFYSSGTRVTTTHRIVDVETAAGRPAFRTKGDAVDRPDAELVDPKQVVGRVAFSIPLVGHLFEWFGTTVTLLVFVVLPNLAVGTWSVLHVAGSAGERTEDAP